MTEVRYQQSMGSKQIDVLKSDVLVGRIAFDPTTAAYVYLDGPENLIAYDIAHKDIDALKRRVEAFLTTRTEVQPAENPELQAALNARKLNVHLRGDHARLASRRSELLADLHDLKWQCHQELLRASALAKKLTTFAQERPQVH